MIGLSFLSGLIGLIGSAVKDDFSNLTLCMMLMLVVPIVLWVSFLITIATGQDKVRDALNKELFESSLTADEIIKLSEIVKTNLFGIAVTKRCRELGLDGVPEWCVRDGVLPTEKDIHS